MVLQQLPVNRRRNVLANDRLPPCRPYQAFHHAGADLGDIPRWHEEHCSYFRIQVGVDIPHAAFELVVGAGADAAKNVRGSHRPRIVNEVPVGECGNRNIADRAGRFTKHAETYFERKCTFLVRIRTNGDDEVIEESRALFDHPEVALRQGIKAAGVDSNPLQSGFRAHSSDCRPGICAGPCKEETSRFGDLGCLTFGFMSVTVHM